jgi:hypothetical protein
MPLKINNISPLPGRTAVRDGLATQFNGAEYEG